jgi:hypothetical protein
MSVRNVADHADVLVVDLKTGPAGLHDRPLSARAQG